MKIKADFHNHGGTRIYRGSFNKVIDKSCESLGPSGILGWISFSDRRYELFANSPGYERQKIGNAVYIPQKDILVIKGQEIGTKEGHLLVLGLKEEDYVKDNLSLEDTLKSSKDKNTIIIADHPFYLRSIGKYLKRKPAILEQLDAIEIHNGNANYIPFFVPREANKKAREFYNETSMHYDFGAVSSSDGHSVAEIGSSYTLIEKPSFENSEKLVETLRKSIREHKDFSQDKKHSSYLRTAEHGIKLLGLIGLYKVGMRFDEFPCKAVKIEN